MLSTIIIITLAGLISGFIGFVVLYGLFVNNPSEDSFNKNVYIAIGIFVVLTVIISLTGIGAREVFF